MNLVYYYNPLLVKILLRGMDYVGLAAELTSAWERVVVLPVVLLTVVVFPVALLPLLLSPAVVFPVLSAAASPAVAAEKPPVWTSTFFSPPSLE